MRLHLKLSKSKSVVPFNYQGKLSGVFHKWMGWNDIHDEISLYSLSWLKGGTMVSEGFNFSAGANWFISIWEKDIAEKLMKGLLQKPDVFYGMYVDEVQLQDNPDFGTTYKFNAASPILIRKYNEEKQATHLTYKDYEADKFMTETLNHKLGLAGLKEEAMVKFDRTYPNPKTKVVDINGIKNKANLCPVVIKGSPTSLAFAWNVGVGHSTGCCFGALC